MCWLPKQVDISYYPGPDEDGRPTFVIGVSRDVSDLRFAEESARAAAERLSILLDSVDVAILGIGKTLAIDFANHLASHYLRELGAPAELLARGITGTPLHLLLRPRDALAVLAHIVDVLESGEPQTFERDVELRGVAHRFAVQIRPERDNAGGVRGAVVVARDVTLERQRDAQLRLSERMVSLARIAAGVAHEIANPLSAVYGNLELVRLSIEQLRSEHHDLAETLGELEDMLGDAHEGTERIRQIIEEIGLLVRADTAGLNRINPRELVDEVLRELRDRLRLKAQLQVEAEPVPDIAGSRPQLSQVLMSLLENAILAMPPGRSAASNRIGITVTRDRDEVVLRIRDNGIGMSAEDLPHVFDPFFTTRSVNEGMGLGLTIAHGIVSSHQGTLSLESTLDEGSTVTLRLPIPHD
jgi:signal transduction histidine kinase